MVRRVIRNYLHPPKRVYRILDTLAYHAKSLYNVGLYNVRQHYQDYHDNLCKIRELRPDQTAKIPILVGSYLPYTRKKTHPCKDISNYVQSRPNENYGLLHSDVAQQTLKSVEEAYRGYFELYRMYLRGETGVLPRSSKIPAQGRTF